MEDTQISNQDHEQKIQAVLAAIENAKSKVDTQKYNYAYSQLLNCIYNLADNSLSTEEAERIINVIVEAEIKIGELLLSIFLDRCQLHSLNKDCVENIFNLMKDNIIFGVYDSGSLSKKFLDACGENSLDADCVKMALERIHELFNFNENSLPGFLNACEKNSLDGENLENIYHSCYEYLFRGNCWKDKIDNKLTSETSKKLFQKLCEFHELEKGKKRNKKLEILGIIGITFGGLSGLAAIGLGAAVGIGALAVTIVAPIVAAVVGLALIGIFSYFVDKSRVNKVLNEIEEAKLNKQEVDVKKIPSDLRHRKKIQDALDESKAPLLQDAENEIVQ